MSIYVLPSNEEILRLHSWHFFSNRRWEKRCTAIFVIRQVYKKVHCHPEEEAGAFPADDEWISLFKGQGHIKEKCEECAFPER